MQFWGEKSEVEREKFRNASNKLLNKCFLLKYQKESKKEYIFVLQNIELFTSYFELLGYTIKINKSHGVIGLENEFSLGRLQLNKYETVAILILRLLYIEKVKEIGEYKKDVVILMEEFREKYKMLEISGKAMLDKKTERQVFYLFRKLNIIKNIEKDITEPEARIIIYPSICFVVDNQGVEKMKNETTNLLEKFQGGEQDVN